MEIKDYKIRKINGKYINLSLKTPESEQEQNTAFLKDETAQCNGIIYNFAKIFPNKIHPDKIKISADLIFCNDKGTIIKIHKKPNSIFNKSIYCYQTKYIIQVENGECDRLGLNIGDVLVFNNNIFNTPDFVKGMFYTNGEEYFCKSSNGIYYYSYLSHSWLGPINENNEWQFYERYSALKNNKKYFRKSGKRRMRKKRFKVIRRFESQSSILL